MKQKQEEKKSEEQKQEAEREEGQGEKKEEKPLSPVRPEPGEEEQKPEAGHEEERPAPTLQGQMSKENALRILNALKESEQGLQVLRQPRKQSDSEPAKDW